MIDRLISRHLSSKLLLMTIGFVMLAELVIFVPSAALFRDSWLNDRADRAALLTEAVTGVQDFQASEMLLESFMKQTDVIMLSAKRGNRSELILGIPPEDATDMKVIDLRQSRRFPSMTETARDFFGPKDGFLRVISASPIKGQDGLELIIPREKLRWALRDFFERIFWLSLAIAVITGALIYWAMLAMIISPVQRLAQDMTAFRENPSKRRNRKRSGFRADEIGQLEREFLDMKQSVRMAFRQRERLAGLGLAVAKINHDLRNVLSSALLMSDRLSHNPDPKLAEMGEKLTRTVERGVGLTEDVLSYSRADALAPDHQDVRISFLLGEVAADVTPEFPNLKFRNKVESALVVRADPEHAYRIFSNLMRNAAQAMVDQASARLSVDASVSDGFVQISVIDNGPGLPDRARQNLFQAFIGGGGGVGSTGLGLSIAKELAQGQGGDIALIRSDETGTHFEVALPQADAT